MLDLKSRFWPAQFGPYSVTGGSYTQAGAGDPSPANIRAISPWKAAGASTAVTRTGKNQLNSAYKTTGNWSNIGYSCNVANYGFMLPYVVAGQAYTIKAVFNDPVNFPLYFYFVEYNTVTSSATNRYFSTEVIIGTLTYSFTASGTYVYYLRCSATDLAKVASVDVQLEKGSSATAHEPYISKSCTLAAPAELYAGYLGDDWQWRRTWNGKVYDGTETPNSVLDTLANHVLANYPLPVTLGAVNASAVCSHFIRSYDNDDDDHFYMGTATFVMFIPKTLLGSNDVAGVKAWLAAQYAASTPVRVSYELSTPVVVAPTFP